MDRPSRPKKVGSRPILCLDFDGVLHWYRQGWQGPGVIDDEPVPGAVAFVTRAQQFFNVVVFSSRSSQPGGIDSMREWMKKHGFPEVDFATQKPGAFLTIDDRALTFTGNWPDPQELRNFQPWTRQPAPDLDQIETPYRKEQPKMLKDILIKNRSYRRFYQDETIEMETLRELIDLARLSPSAANMQPLKYILSNHAEKNAQIFETLAWAGYLRDWPGPEEGERPSAYIIILGDSSVARSYNLDFGIAAQSIMLGAAERGLGGCMIGSIKKPELTQLLVIPEQYEILLVLALGKPKETVQIEPIPEDGSIRYWRDEQQVHHVPKRALDDLILE
jgi:nitroreductase